MNIQRSAAITTMAAVMFLSCGHVARVQAITSLNAESARGDALRVDRGAEGLWRTLQQLNTRASLMMVTAHPDDEDGGMLTYESRGIGADTSLLTLNRGEGGQNAITDDYWDELGILRTQELLAADDRYGVHQYWTRVADFGFSKTLDETFANWGHDRVLADVVRQVRISRPLVITSVYAGNVSDGHGHHQAAGVMAQEAYKLSGDPKVFPEQIAAGLQPWSPLKVYAHTPIARVTKKGIFDYATGHWAPLRFKNYVTEEWIDGIPTTTVRIPEGTYDPLSGESYFAEARGGLARQKSQGVSFGKPLPGPFESTYHLYASRLTGHPPDTENGFFDNVDISLTGMADYAPASVRAVWHTRLATIQTDVSEARKAYNFSDPSKCALPLSQGLKQTRRLLRQLNESSLPTEAKYNMGHELSLKEEQFNRALGQALGMIIVSAVRPAREEARMGPFGDMRGSMPTAQTVIAGQSFAINVHIANQGRRSVHVDSTVLVSTGGDWKVTTPRPFISTLPAGDARDIEELVVVPEDAPTTRPYFSRPSLEQPYYELDQPQYLGQSTMPYPLGARVLYTYAGVQGSVEGVVQSVHLIDTVGPTLEPLMVVPALSVQIQPRNGIMPLGNDHLILTVKLRSNAERTTQGDLNLKLPQGWTSEPAVEHFSFTRNGEERNITFKVSPSGPVADHYSITAVATDGTKRYSEGFTTIVYPGLRPYPIYRKAEFKATRVDIKVAQKLNIAYVMGTGDEVPSALQEIGVSVIPLSANDLATVDLSRFDVVVLGIRAYANRPQLRDHNDLLLNYVNHGGVVIVQYQTAEYDRNYGPYPISVPGDAEKVVEETAKVMILDPRDPLLNWPNKITDADFADWVEERGHGFARSWDSHFKALIETHDADQAPQNGGLLYARYGKGIYVYTAFAFFRQLPEGVPGSFRLIANLISSPRNLALLDKTEAK